MKNLYILFVMIVSLLLFDCHKANAIPNPWKDCGDDISCGANKAGFNFPLRAKNIHARAMKNMIELSFPLDKKRNVTVRKSSTYNPDSGTNETKDISGDYNSYPINKAINMNNGTMVNVRGDKNKYYVANFVSGSGYYSLLCRKGLKLKDLNNLYNLIEETELHKTGNNTKSNYTIEQLRNERIIDGIVEPVYTQDCFPRTLQKKGVSKKCFERANLGENSFCSASEIKMIKEYFKKEYKKDPLRYSSGQFCAKSYKKVK